MSKVHILDDTEFVLDLLKPLLKGHQVFTYTDPEMFLKSLDSSVDVIITDLRVARYDAIKHIRGFKGINIAVKVIVMSAYFTEDVLFQLIDCHVFKAVKKTHEFGWFEEVAEAVNK